MSRFHWRGLAVYGLALAACAGWLRAEDYPPVKRDEVLRTLKEHQAVWKEKAATAGPMYLDADEIRRLREAVRGNDTTERVEALRGLIREAQAMARKPATPYLSPTEVVAARKITKFDSEQELWQREVGDEIVKLSFAAVLSGDEAIRRRLRESVVTACRYPQWGIYGPSIDLACGHVSRGIAVAWSQNPDLWNEEDRRLILATIRERANQLLAGVYGKAFWHRAYQDNHNEVSVTGLGLCGVAFFDLIPEAPEWLAAARLNFQNVCRYSPEDGSSHEGVGYWSYGTAFLLQYIEGTRRVIDSADLYDASFLRNAAAYRLHVSTSGLGGSLTWGDALSSGFNARYIVYRLADQYHDATAAWLADKIALSKQDPPRDYAVWSTLWKPTGLAPKAPVELDHHLREGDVVTTRSGWGGGDYLLSVKSGFTNRNHTHLDAGALELAFGDEWLLTAPGYGKGSGLREFWDFNGGKRWDFFSNATESHTALLVNGRNQRFDRQARGTITQYCQSPGWAWTAVDLTSAYHDVSSLTRRVLHRRNDYLLVIDTLTAARPVKLEWLAQLGSDPILKENGFLLLGDMGQLRVSTLLPPVGFKPRQPTAPNVDIPASAIRTLSAAQEGSHCEFLTLLQPGFATEPLPELRTRLTKEGGRHVLTVNGKDWEDTLFLGDKASPLVWRGKGGEVQAEAQSAAFRLDKDGLESILLTGTTGFKTPFLEWRSQEAAECVLTRGPRGGWIVDASAEPAGWKAAAGMVSRVEPGSGVSGHPFRALIAPEQEALAALQQRLDTPPPARPDPTLSIAVRLLPPQPALAQTEKIRLEAEQVATQRNGNVETAQKPGASGLAVRGFGNTSPNQMLTWRFRVAKPGQYQMTVRYATNLAEVKVAVLVDGAAPDANLAKTTLPGTGGWSTDKDDWKNFMVTDGKQRPFTFNLAEGEHELRLVGPSVPINLDWLEFSGVGK